MNTKDKFLFLSLPAHIVITVAGIVPEQKGLLQFFAVVGIAVSIVHPQISYKILSERTNKFVRITILSIPGSLYYIILSILLSIDIISINIYSKNAIICGVIVSIYLTILLIYLKNQ